MPVSSQLKQFLTLYQLSSHINGQRDRRSELTVSQLFYERELHGR